MATVDAHEFLNRKDYADRLGITIRLRSGAEMTFLGFGTHLHAADDTEPCYERATVFFTVANISLVIGFFRDYEDPEKYL